MSFLLKRHSGNLTRASLLVKPLGLQPSTRSIVRLVTKDKTLGSFDSRDAPLEKVNPYALPTKANAAAGVSHIIEL